MWVVLAILFLLIACSPTETASRSEQSPANRAVRLIVLILCSPPPHSSLFQPTAAKVQIHSKPLLE